MPNGLLSDDSLRTHPDGLALSLTLPWYRSLWLSSVGTLRVTIDGAPVDPADLAAIGEYVVFVQAKFHDIDEHREDQQIPWRPVLQGLKDAGYTGYLSSEYEGVREPWRSLEQVRRQHSLMREIASSLD